MTFRNSPLITIERMKQDMNECFALKPDWAQVVYVIEGGLDKPDPELCPMIILFKDEPTLEAAYTVDAYMVALLFEGTRFGNSVVCNSNRGLGNGNARYYPKFTNSKNNNNNITINRISKNAIAGQAVATNKARPLDIRAEGLAVKENASSLKAGRKIFMDAVEWAAKNNAPEDFDVKAYLKNIEDLFAAHDGLEVMPEVPQEALHSALEKLVGLDAASK
jgi:hypothetical protein